MGEIDQFSQHNQDEVKQDLAGLLSEQNLDKELNPEKKAHTLYKEILGSFDAAKIESIIHTLFQNTNGSWKSYTEIIAHPSHDLVTQICLDYLGYHGTKLDADYGSRTTAEVKRLQKEYNSKYNKHIQEDGDAGEEFFTAVLTMLEPEKTLSEVTRDTRTQEPLATLTPKQPILTSIHTHDVLEKVEENIGIQMAFDTIERARGVKPPITAQMIIDIVAKTLQDLPKEALDIITAELATAIARKETGLGTDCIGRVKQEGREKYAKGNVKYSYYNIGNVQYANPQSREEGIQVMVNNLKRRYTSFKEIYGDQTPTVMQLLSNQGPDNKGFLEGQANYQKPNPQAMGAYCASGISQKVGDKEYPKEIAGYMRKMESTTV